MNIDFKNFKDTQVKSFKFILEKLKHQEARIQALEKRIVELEKQ